MSRATSSCRSGSASASSPATHDIKQEESPRDSAQPVLVVRDDISESTDDDNDNNNNDDERHQPGGDAAAHEKLASSQASVNNIHSVPDGGLVAWLQVVGSFFIFFNSWGIVNTFGVYQTFYETKILSGYTPSDIAWIGSFQGTLLLLIGALTGPVYDAGYVRTLIALGTFLTVFGQMMLSLSREYYQVFLSQAVCVGLGTACMFIPGVAVLSTYFSTRLATAIGIAASGSSIGGVVYPIIFYRLQPAIGFAWATRVIGFIMLGTLAISNAFIKVRVLPAGKRKLVDLTAWTEGPFTFFVLGCFIGFLGLYTPFFYIQSYAIQTGLAQPDLAFYLLAVINAASTFGRIIPNYCADKIGHFNVLIPCTFATGILCISLIGTHSIAPVIVLAALYGFFSGTFVSLPGSIYVVVTKNRGLIGTRMGMGFAVTSIGILVGTPITGAILDASSYTYVWLFGGLMTVASAFIVAAARVCKGGWKLSTRV